jgi:hypothetical protein
MPWVEDKVKPVCDLLESAPQKDGLPSLKFLQEVVVAKVCTTGEHNLAFLECMNITISSLRY